MKSVGIYVPSCKRSDQIKTYYVVDNCTYVVRESEKEEYIRAGIDPSRLWSVKDELISSLPMTRQYIIDNSKEDIVIQLDDDIEKFGYVNHNNIIYCEKDQIVDELYRIAQIVDDLHLGVGSVQQTIDVRKYNQEFKFKGIIGVVMIFDKEYLKGKYDTNNKTKGDIDFELQELLHNRIVIQSNYFCPVAKQDKNAGGANVGKTKQSIKNVIDYMKTKWGKYIDFDYQRNLIKVKVKR